jgi:hypothetical protein
MTHSPLAADTHHTEQARPALFLVPSQSPEEVAHRALDKARREVAVYVKAPLGARRVSQLVAGGALETATAAARAVEDEALHATLAATRVIFTVEKAKDQARYEAFLAAHAARQERAKRLVDAPADVAEKAARWVAHRPELATRMEKAMALVGGIERTDEANTYKVEGGKGDYIVRVDRGRRYSECTCPDSAVRGQKCKHRLAVALVLG